MSEILNPTRISNKQPEPKICNRIKFNQSRDKFILCSLQVGESSKIATSNQTYKFQLRPRSRIARCCSSLIVSWVNIVEVVVNIVLFWGAESILSFVDNRDQFTRNNVSRTLVKSQKCDYNN